MEAYFALSVGFEPTTTRLTVGSSTTELRENLVVTKGFEPLFTTYQLRVYTLSGYNGTSLFYNFIFLY